METVVHERQEYAVRLGGGWLTNQRTRRPKLRADRATAPEALDAW
ncbi:hypothetical protein [Streptomyces iconiensis]|uniref:Uncharacterized protein n=1 Tax=Streptomyces iconiensis TaxID=1384038 RepID=A0ABT7A369_9ACTN|nr:hypothetical protein [Streptomyces iconiensis]MDJ1135756.1 hypothetical protein [Streptomyces iconiensis]